jgi:hypothetical protein
MLCEIVTTQELEQPREISATARNQAFQMIPCALAAAVNLKKTAQNPWFEKQISQNCLQGVLHRTHKKCR